MFFPSIWPPSASNMASKRGLNALQVLIIYSLVILAQASLIEVFKVSLLEWGVLQASVSTTLYIE